MSFFTVNSDQDINDMLAYDLYRSFQSAVEMIKQNGGTFEDVKNICDNDDSICGIRLYVERENYVAQKTYSNLGMHECNYHMYEYEK